MPSSKADFSIQRKKHMSRWYIKDFKSIGKGDVILDHGHLTIMTGANSVGKSSLLQSILMLCQTISYGDEIILNGPLTKLGTPSDVVRSGSECCRMGIAFELPSSYKDNGSMQVQATIEMAPNNARKSEDLEERMHIRRIEIDSRADYRYVLTRSNVKRADESKCFEFLGPRYSGCQLLKVAPFGERSLNRTYVAIRGFMPVALIFLQSEQAARSECRQELESLLESNSSHKMIASYRKNRDLLVAIFDALQRSGVVYNPEKERPAIATAVNAIRKMGKQKREAFINDVVRQAFEAWTCEAIAIGRELSSRARLQLDDFDDGEKVINELVIVLNGLVDELTALAERVVYIGPLRDDPRVVSPLTEELGKNLPIGRKGEKAASVLLSSAREINLFGFPEENKLREASLAEAVSSWARYLGVAGEVHVANMQKLGVSLHVVTDDIDERDLTMVGVGASQAIPILVGVLTARRGAAVIIEQPELHLHPSAQAKLADFFLKARPDLTFLIESHSEALVTRLRRRVVENEQLSQRISILFFEKMSDASGVAVRKLTIDEYGNLESWPDGFMDAVQEDTRAIMKGSIEKRRARRAHV